VPGVMATRTLSSERDRKMTITLTPFMSCTAKLPIYGFFAHMFFPKYSGLVMVGLYLLGILVGILFALVAKRTMFKGEPVPFVMELPNYRLPGVKNVSRLLWDKAKDFITRAFTFIFIASILVWFLQSFDFKLNYITDATKQDTSILAKFAGFISPIFKPLGFGDWKMTTSLISGFIAKESVVSTITVLFGSATLPFASSTIMAFLVFCLLYTPCIAAVASVKRELGKRWAFIIVLLQCSVAYVVAFIVKYIWVLIALI
jgi:ferrous iron transport protein B